MSDINWGLLTPLQQTDPIKAAAPQASSGSAPVGNPSAGMEGAASMMNAATERQRLQFESDANKRANQMQPLLMQGQNLQNQGQGLLNQKSLMEIQSAKRKQQAQQNADAAFHQAQKSGATMEQSMDAFQGQLTPEDQITFSDVRQNHQELARKNNVTAINDAAGISAQANRMIDSIKQSNLPAKEQADQINSLLKSVNANLDRIDPKHPPIKTEKDLNLYSVATVGTLMNPRVQAGFNFELNKIKYNNDTKAQANVWEKQNTPTDLQKSQNDVRQAQANLQQAQQSGDQKAIQQAQTELNQAQAEVRGQISGKTLGGQIGGIVGNAAAGSGGLVDKTMDYLHNIGVTQTPQAGQGPSQPQQVPAQPGQQPVAPQSNQPTQQDLEFTAQKYGMTVDQVKAKLGIQ